MVQVKFQNVGFWGEGRIGVPRKKHLGAKQGTNNKLNPNMASMSGFELKPY